MTGSNSDDMIKRQFTVGFQGGFDGVSPTVKKAKYGDTKEQNMYLKIQDIESWRQIMG